MKIEIKSATTSDEFILILPVQLPKQLSDNFYENWMPLELQVSVGPWKGKPVKGELHLSETIEFLKNLRNLVIDLKGSVRWQSTEAWIDLSVACDSTGHLLFSGEILDEVAGKNSLLFELTADQSQFSSLPDKIKNYLNL